MEPIEVNNHFENKEFPTRVGIIDLDGNFEHAGAYTGPKYTFSVEVEVKYNKVVNGKEENLITCTFGTKTDSSVFSFEDDDLDEESVEDWFLEGLSEDLSFHGFEGLEKLDLYTLGVPTNENDEAEKTIEEYISNAFKTNSSHQEYPFMIDCRIHYCDICSIVRQYAYVETL